MFYEKFLDLCVARNISPSAAAQDAGFSNAAATDWKNGAKPRKANLIKLAKYFNVSVEYFEESTDIKKDLAKDDEVVRSDMQEEIIQYADQASEEEQKKVLDYIRFLRSQRE